MVVRFTPIGAHLFLGLPMHLIANEAVELALIDRALARLLVDRMASARSWTDRFAIVESLVAERVTRTKMPASIDVAWRRLVAADGRVAMGSLASGMDCSHRTLIARFRASVGFPPKTMARLLRFGRTLRALDRLSGVRAETPAGKPYIEAERRADRSACGIPWADLAAECGYADQAHLIRDFREFAGRTPDAFLRHVSFQN
jgi:AraC-like DNA-binding protein